MTHSHTTFSLIGLLVFSGLLSAQAQDGDPGPIAIAEVERDQPVDFGKDIYPVLRKNCIACHNSSKAKGQLNLEDPKAIIKGGSEGPAVIPGKPEESFLLQVAAHQEDPIMPPEGNKSNAVPLTPEELGLLKLWIAEGAKGEAMIATATPTEWILAHRADYPVYHMALGPEDRFVAASRGQRVFLYDIHGGNSLGELVDPALASEEVFQKRPPAHKDFVQSIAFSSEGWLATGGFRNVKLWKPLEHSGDVLRAMPEAITPLTSSHDGQWAAAGDSAGHVLIWKPENSEWEPKQAKRHEGKVSGLSFSRNGEWLGSAGADGKAHLVNADSGEILHSHSSGEPLHDVLVLEDLERMVVAADSGKIFQWALGKDGSSLPEWAGHEKAAIALAAGAPDAKQILSAGADGKVKVWDLSESNGGGKEVRALDHGEPLVALAVSPNGERLVSVSSGAAKVWKVQDGAHLKDLEAAPELFSEQGLLKRRHAIAQTLVENRKKKVEEREKAWKDEVEKAKKAASDQLAAKGKRDEADRADHVARLKRIDSQGTIDASTAELADLKARVGSGEANVKELAERLAKERERVGPKLQDLATKLGELTSQHQAEATALQERRAAMEKHVRVREKSQTALAALRQVGELLDGESGVADVIHGAENLLADAQQRLSGAEAEVFRMVEEEREAAVAMASAQKEHDSLASVVSGLEGEHAEATQTLEASKASLSKGEEAHKKVAEAHKKVEEETQKAIDALVAANKSHDQAIENEELALRLSQRASEAHTRAQTALTIAEALLKKRQEAVDGAAKQERPKLAAVAFNATGDRLAIGRLSGGLVVFRTEGEAPGEVLGDQAVEGLAPVASGAWIAGSPDKELRRLRSGSEWLWTRTVGAIDDPKALIDRVTAVAFSPNGTLLATGSGSPSRSGQLKIWRVADGTLLREMEDAHSDSIVGLEFSPDGRYLATASTDRFAKVFNVSDGALVTAFEGHTGHVLDVSWRADGLVLATAGADNVIKLWDFEEKRQLKTISGYNQEITSVAFADTAEKLVTSSGDKSVRLGGDRLDGKEFVYASALSQDGQWLIAGAQDSVVRVWQTKDKKLVQEFAAPGQ